MVSIFEGASEHLKFFGKEEENVHLQICGCWLGAGQFMAPLCKSAPQKGSSCTHHHKISLGFVCKVVKSCGYSLKKARSCTAHRRAKEELMFDLLVQLCGSWVGAEA